MLDTPKHQGLRNVLVKTLQEKGIQSTEVLQAIARVPRHLLLDTAFEQHAYQDKAFPIASGQTISQPYTVAFQSELLQIKPGDKILEIGTGSGYQAAILIEMKARVYTIERIKELYLRAKSNLNKIGYRPKYTGYSDGYKGLPLYAPYDKIIVTAAAPYIPQTLIEQLKIGGRLVIPVGIDKQIMTVITKIDKTKITKSEHGIFQFVPMLKQKQ